RRRPLCLRTAVTVCPEAVGPLPRGVSTTEGRPCLPTLSTCLGHPGLLRIPHQGVQKCPPLVLFPPRCTSLRRPRRCADLQRRLLPQPCQWPLCQTQLLHACHRHDVRDSTEHSLTAHEQMFVHTRKPRRRALGPDQRHERRLTLGEQLVDQSKGPTTRRHRQKDGRVPLARAGVT